MWDKIETYIVVTVIAALIWLYAEGENVKLYDNVQVEVTFVSPPGSKDLVIETDPETPVRVRMSVTASASNYTQLNRALARLDGPLTITAQDTQGLDQVVSLKDRLAETQVFEELGITIESTDPATVTVNAQNKVELTLPIEVVTGDLALAGLPTVEPAEAKVRVPADEAERVRGLKLQARLTALSEIDSLPVGVPQEVPVPLTLPIEVEGWEATPSRASVRFAIEKRTISLKLPPVRVVVSALPSVLDQYEIIVAPENRLLRDVMIRGPVDTIARIESGAEQVFAQLIFLKSDELKAGEEYVLPEFRLPPGVQLDSASQRVEVTVRRREAASPLPPELTPAAPFEPPLEPAPSN